MPRELARGLIDLVELIPFDVQFALTVDLDTSIFQVIDVVEVWLADSFDMLLEQAGYADADLGYAPLDGVILDERSARWLLEEAAHRHRYLDQEQQQDETNGVLYTARMKGHALFGGDEDRPNHVPVGDVLEMQRTVLQDRDALLLLKTSLQENDPDGIGTSLVDVNAYLNPTQPTPAASSTSSSDDQLQLIIIIAVGVACLAFLFLILAVVWAWRYDRQNRQAYLVHGSTGGSAKKDRTGSSETTEDERNVAAPPLQAIYPRHLQQQQDGASLNGEVYPDSVITDDISSSLSQYYRSGLAQHAASNPYLKSKQLSDAASVSSMESYGYSLDGYAPTVATPMPSDTPEKKK